MGNDFHSIISLEGKSQNLFELCESKYEKGGSSAV